MGSPASVLRVLVAVAAVAAYRQTASRYIGSLLLCARMAAKGILASVIASALTD
jgi:hypothetical protein